jgi:GT2 family glycosyltransferase
MCLGGNILAGENQKPYGGKLDYDYMMWIDSDIVFTPQQFQRLLDHKEDIVSGLYLMDGGTAYATVKDWNEEYFQQNGNFQFMTPDQIKPFQQNGKLFPSVYTGFGFVLIKRGVFESMKYPWFKPEFVDIRGSKDFTMEDVAWCREVTKLGYKVMIDPNIVVGHEKTKIYI